MIRATELRTERLVDPIGLGTATPRLSWMLEATAGETDVTQDAWRIEVGDGDDVFWDSGRIDGREQSIAYDGPALGSRAKRWWRVRVWTTAGESEWSDRAAFELGLLDPDDWTAQMITANATTPVVRFTKSFDVADVGAARLYLTAHGADLASINGREVGDEILAPGWTTYRHRIAVRTHDVTAYLQAGANRIDVLVAPAWYSGCFGLGSDQRDNGYYGTHVGVLAQLEVDGEVVVATDSLWTATSTPFLQAEIYDGETYDSRFDYDAAETADVTTVDLDRRVLVAPPVPPVRRTEVLLPKERTIVGDSVLQIDFGQNLVGWMSLTVRDAEPGTEIVMRHAEILDNDGRLYTEPLRSAKATDTYIARGDPVEECEPTFTFHGFRYAEISGIDPEQVEVEAVVVHSDLERTGSFECSHEPINQLHSNVVWGQRGNFVSVPTDCPQRDERLGWTGDAQVFSPTASFLFDCETFLGELARRSRGRPA